MAWHGIALHCIALHCIVAALGSGFECVAIDLPGFGDAHDASDWSVAGMADHVAAAVATRGAARWLLLGHSMGGKIASVVASRALAGEDGLFGLAGVVLLRLRYRPNRWPKTDAGR